MIPSIGRTQQSILNDQTLNSTFSLWEFSAPESEFKHVARASTILNIKGKIKTIFMEPQRNNSQVFMLRRSGGEGV